jgi:hypothetical protein
MHHWSNGLNRHRIFHPTIIGYTFLSATYKIFSKLDHILGHKTNFNTYKKMEIISYIILDHNGIKLEINKRNYINT